MIDFLAQAATTLPTTQAVELAHDAAAQASQPAWVAAVVAVCGAIAAVLIALTGFFREVNTRGTLGTVVGVLNQFHGRSVANEQNVKALAQVVNDASAVPARVQLAELPPIPATIATQANANCPPPAAVAPPVIVQETQPQPPRVQT